MSYRPWERKTLQKEWRKTTKKLIRAWTESYGERKSWKLFGKMSLNTWRTVFSKLSIRFSIDWKLGSMNRKCFDWSSINRALIETDRGWPIFLIATLIYWKIGSIERNFGKKQIFEKSKQFCAETPQSIEFNENNAWIWDEMFFKNTSFEPSFPNIKIFNPFS